MEVKEKPFGKEARTKGEGRQEMVTRAEHSRSAQYCNTLDENAIMKPLLYTFHVY